MAPHAAKNFVRLSCEGVCIVALPDRIKAAKRGLVG